MIYLLQRLHFVTLAFSAYGALDPYFKELLKIVARKQILRSEEIETDISEEQIKQKGKIEDTIEDHKVIARQDHRVYTEAEKDQLINQTLENSYFCPVPYEKQIKAQKLNPEDFQWIARVYHSPGKELPICTAASIRINIFATAARCLATTKVGYTYVHFNKLVYRPRAFVLPDNPTKQMFDDAGLIIVDGQYTGLKWFALTLTSLKKTGKGFFWFDQQIGGVPDASYNVVGFVVDQNGKEDLYSVDNVNVGTDICHRLFRIHSAVEGYFVPCVHTCSVHDQMENGTLCARYLAGLGHAVLESGKLLGVVTWTCENDDYVTQYRLPMGVTILNSEAFYEDFKCATKISSSKWHKDGLYSPVCKNNKTIRTRLNDI